MTAKRFSFTANFSRLGKDGMLVAFYKVSHGIGFIPCEVDFMYRGKRYTTMQVISALYKLVSTYQSNFEFHFTKAEWYRGTNLDNKKFVALSKQLMKEQTPLSL